MILGNKRNETIFLYNLIQLRKRSGHSAKWVDNVLKLIFQDLDIDQTDIRIRLLQATSNLRDEVTKNH